MNIEYNPGRVTTNDTIHYINESHYIVLPDGQTVQWCRKTNTFNHNTMTIKEYITSIFKDEIIKIKLTVGDFLVTSTFEHWVCYEEGELRLCYGGRHA